MKEIEYTGIRNRGTWAAGPWDNEPQDKVQFTDPATGLPCLARRNNTGNWCGYVGVAEGHSLFGKDGDRGDLNVHGGITFTSFCDPNDPEDGICHIPEPGEPDRVWWFGFDTAHGGDLAPDDRHGLNAFWFEATTYKTLVYVKAECASLAAQLAP